MKIFSIDDAKVKQALIPNFDQPHSPEDGSHVIRVNTLDIKTFGIKIIKGIEWIKDKRFVPKEDIKIDIVSPAALNNFVELIDQYGVYFNCGESIRIGRAICEDNPNCRLFYIEIWKQLKLIGTTGSK